MKISAIIFDCVGPILIRDENIVFDEVTDIINHQCSKATNEVEFWESVSDSYHLKMHEKKQLINRLAIGFKKNMLMWKWISKIKRNYKLGLINNGTSTIFQRWILSYDFESVFDKILNSSIFGIRKPNVRIYLEMAKLLNVNPNECIFIDDSEKNVAGAIVAGMKGIVYNPKKHEEFLLEINKLCL